MVARIPPKRKVERVQPKANPQPKNDGRFKPGQRAAVGNRGPVMKLAKRFLTAAVVDKLSEVVDAKKGTRILHQLAEKLIKRALTGELAAINAVFDRVEGRPVQAVELSGVGGKPIQTISGKMTPQEAARVFAEELNRLDFDDVEVESEEGDDGKK